LKILSLLETATDYPQTKYSISRHLLKTSLHYCAKHKSFKKGAFVLSILDHKAVPNFVIILWIVNRFEKHILRIWNIASLLQWPLIRLAYCQSSKFVCMCICVCVRIYLYICIC